MSNKMPNVTRIWTLEDEQTSQSKNRVLKDPCDVTFISAYTFAVADSVGHVVYVFNLTSNDGKALKIGTNQVWPNGIAITSDSKIRICDRKSKSIKTFDLRGDLLSTWRIGSEEDVTARPHGIAINSKEETIVTDTHNHCVYIFNPDGSLKKTFCSKGDLLHQLRLPFYVTVDQRDHILVSDNLNYCVKIFDCNGNFISRIGSGNLFGQRQFQSPYGLCVDSSNHRILVCDNESNKVFSYDHNSQFQGYILSGAECINPCSVAVGSSCGTMVLTQSSIDFSNITAYRISDIDVKNKKNEVIINSSWIW